MNLAAPVIAARGIAAISNLSASRLRRNTRSLPLMLSEAAQSFARDPFVQIHNGVQSMSPLFVLTMYALGCFTLGVLICRFIIIPIVERFTNFLD